MSVQLFLLYLVLVLVVCVLYYRWSRRKLMAAVAHMHGPPAWPLIGHLYLLLNRSSEETIFQTMLKLRIYPSPIVFWVGPLVHIGVFKPEHVQIVLNSPHCYSKPWQYEFFRVNRGLFSAPGHVWKGQRKMLNLSFGNAILNSFVGIFNAKSQILTEILGNFAGQQERDISHYIAKCFLDTIYSTAFGLDFNLQRTEKGNNILKIQEDYLDLVTDRIFQPWLYPECLYRLTKNSKREQEILKYWRDLTISVMDATNSDELLNAEDDSKNPFDKLDGKKPQIFLDSLMDLARETDDMTKEDIIDHLITIIIAGNDTTATTLSHLMLMLAIHQDIQERVFQEIMQACPDKDQPVSIEDVAKLTYTEMVCKETMRLYPIAPILGRVATEDIRLDDKNVIPANSTIVTVMYQLHRDPANWGPEPDKFNPDHFLPDVASKRHPYSFLPFSGGPRNCIGTRYAWNSMKILITHVLRRYRLRTSLTMDTIQMKDSIIMRIMNGCLVSLEERL